MDKHNSFPEHLSMLRSANKCYAVVKPMSTAISKGYMRSPEKIVLVLNWLGMCSVYML